MAERKALQDKKGWESEDYLPITEFAIKGDTLQVQFANGDHVGLPLQSLTPSDLANARLGEARIETQGHFVLIPSLPRDIVISTKTIRMSSDDEYREYVEDVNAGLASKMLGPALKALRKKSGFTQKQLAEATGMKAPNISMIERGRQPNITMNTLFKMLGVMDMSITDLQAQQVALIREQREDGQEQRPSIHSS